MKIGIIGKMCSGKTTLAQEICRLDDRHNIYSFGTGVKEIAYKYFNMKNKDRSLLVNIGTKFREINEDIWIDYLINNIKNINYCVIDDIRHQNELDRLIDLNFTIIKLHITKEEQIKRLQKLYTNSDDHIKNINDKTETCDFIFPNDFKVININYNDNKNYVNQKIYTLLQKNV